MRAENGGCWAMKRWELALAVCGAICLIVGASGSGAENYRDRTLFLMQAAANYQ